MERTRRSIRAGLLLVSVSLILTVGVVPLAVSGADHLDAPALGGLSDGMGNFAPHSDHGDRDINDVYVFQGSNPSRTVLAMTTNPAVNVPAVQPMPAYGTNVRYILNFDRNGDAVQDLAYVLRFGAPAPDGSQTYRLTRYTGSNARSLAEGVSWGSGSTGGSGVGSARDGVRIFAGRRSDPFFFDLTGFAGSIGGLGTDCLQQLAPEGVDCMPTDFFAGLDTNAIVLEIPDDALGGQIGVWGQTTYREDGIWKKGDQMGRPAINTVFNPSDLKNAFNRTPPSRQRTAMNGVFRTNVINTLMAFSALDSEGAYSSTQAGILADVLLPDVITYDTSTAAVGPLNGRALADDVIDAELNIVTGGFAFAGRDAIGGLTGDEVGPHGDYLSVFPYLGAPHGAP
jgi:hypothetical protein